MLAEQGEDEGLLLRVGERIRNKRKACGFSQEKLAERAEVSPITIHRIEKGENSAGIQSYSSIARALGLSLIELLLDVSNQDERERALLTAWRNLQEPDRAVVFITYMALTEQLRKRNPLT